MDLMNARTCVCVPAGARMQSKATRTVEGEVAEAARDQVVRLSPRLLADAGQKAGCRVQTGCWRGAAGG